MCGTPSGEHRRAVRRGDRPPRRGEIAGHGDVDGVVVLGDRRPIREPPATIPPSGLPPVTTLAIRYLERVRLHQPGPGPGAVHLENPGPLVDHDGMHPRAIPTHRVLGAVQTHRAQVRKTRRGPRDARERRVRPPLPARGPPLWVAGVPTFGL